MVFGFINSDKVVNRKKIKNTILFSKKKVIFGGNKSNKIQQNEYYSVFMGVDKTILNLNPYLKDYGFEFIKVDYKLFEESFSRFLKFDRLDNQKLKDSNTGDIISLKFYDALSKSEYFNPLLNHLFFLKYPIK